MPNKLPNFTPPVNWLRGTRLSTRPLARRYTHMKIFTILLISLFLLSGCSSEPELPRYYALADLAKSEVDKDLIKAEKLAKELLHLSSVEPKDWNYGNAIHFGNMVLGQVALRKGEIEKAEMYLLESGKTPGSPQLDTFGPNMTLAKELLEAERLDVVLEYFELCSQFWEMSDDKLEVWAILAQNGKMPEFGANLIY